MSSRRCKPTDSGCQNAFPALKGPDYRHRQPLSGLDTVFPPSVRRFHLRLLTVRPLAGPYSRVVRRFATSMSRTRTKPRYCTLLVLPLLSYSSIALRPRGPRLQREEL